MVSGVRGVRDVRLWGPDDPDDDPDGPDDDRPGGGATDPENPGPDSGDKEASDPTASREEPQGEDTPAPSEISEGRPQGGTDLLTTFEDVPALVEEIEAAEVVALDLETTGLDPRSHKARLLSLATERRVWVLDVSETDPTLVLKSLGKALVIHNAAFDLAFLRELGYEHEGEVVDTMLLSQLLYAGAKEQTANGKQTAVRHRLEDMCRRELGIALDKEHQTADWAGDISPEMVDYAAKDAEVLIPLHRKLIDRIEKAGLSGTLKLEQRAQRGILWMTRSGLPFDEARWLELAEEAKREAARLNEGLQEMAPPHPDGKHWNWNSPKQVKQALSLLGLTVGNTRDETLARLDHPFARLLRGYRKMNGAATRHAKKWLYSKDGSARVVDGRIYPS